MVVKVNISKMFLLDCRKDGGMQANIAKSDAETFSQLLASVRKVKKMTGFRSWVICST